MSPSEFRDSLQEALLDTLWRQWSALGVSAHEQPEDRFPLDIEALLVATAVFSQHDRRLASVSKEWMQVNGGLVQKSRIVRMTNALKELSGEHHLELVAPGPEDVLLDSRAKPKTESRKVVTPKPAVVATSQVNLRRVFGINARADLLLYLLGSGSGTSAGIARETWFDQKAVYRILESWTDARICQRPGEAGSNGYQLQGTDKWLQLLELDAPVLWVNWFQAFAPLLVIHHAATTPPTANDEYLLSSLMRGLSKDLNSLGREWGMPFPDGRMYSGADYFEPAASAVSRLALSISGGTT